MKLKTTWILFLLFSCATVVYGQKGEQAPLDKNHWQELKKGKDYDNYKSEKIDTSKSSVDFNPPIPSKNIINSLGTVAQLFIVLIVVGIIGVFIFMAVKNNRGIQGNKKINTDLQLEIEQVEADLLNMDLQQLIKQALENLDFQRELRLYYLWCIQLFDGLELVVWKREKTNSAYLRELIENELYWKFSNITHDINQITYGNVDLSDEFYSKLKNELSALTLTLSKQFVSKNKEKLN